MLGFADGLPVGDVVVAGVGSLVGAVVRSSFGVPVGVLSPAYRPSKGQHYF